MTRPRGAHITHEDRIVIWRHLKNQGIKVGPHTTNEELAAAVAKFYGIALPKMHLDRLLLLRRFAHGAYAARKRDLVPSRDVPVFRPLKMSREMRAALERCREIHPEDEGYLET